MWRARGYSNRESNTYSCRYMHYGCHMQVAAYRMHSIRGYMSDYLPTAHRMRFMRGDATAHKTHFMRGGMSDSLPTAHRTHSMRGGMSDLLLTAHRMRSMRGVIK